MVMFMFMVMFIIMFMFMFMIMFMFIFMILLLIQVDHLIPVETSESSNSRPKGFSVTRGQGYPWSIG
jgi:uncharacterized membrane protein YcgQ (UPF0703/DUF1980 family)